MKFVVADIPIECILGNVFLATVEPHGSTRLNNNKVGYFITVPTSDGSLKQIKFPYISTPRVSTMVHTMEALEKASNKLTELKYLKTSMNIGEQLKTPPVIRKIYELRNKIEI